MITLEEYLSRITVTETTEKLIEKLKLYWCEDEEFLLAALVYLKTDEEKKLMIDFIERGEDVSYESITLFCLELYEEKKRRRQGENVISKNRKFFHKKITVFLKNGEGFSGIWNKWLCPDEYWDSSCREEKPEECIGLKRFGKTVIINLSEIERIEELPTIDLEQFFNKTVRVVDLKGCIYTGKVDLFEYAKDNDESEDCISIDCGWWFYESDIKLIEIIDK